MRSSKSTRISLTAILITETLKTQGDTRDKALSSSQEGETGPANLRLAASEEIVFTYFKSSSLTKFPVLFCYGSVIKQRCKVWIYKCNSKTNSQKTMAVQRPEIIAMFKNKVDLQFAGTLRLFTKLMGNQQGSQWGA